jgi:hypothetical protein
MMKKPKNFRKMRRALQKSKRRTPNVNMKRMRYYAEFAEKAYRDGTERADARGEYIPELSTEEIAVFRGGGGRYIIAARGTVIGVKDIATDLVLGAGFSAMTGRVTEFRKVAETVAEKVGKDNLTFVGHSLGGTIANDVGDMMGVRAITFNMGTTPMKWIRDPLGTLARFFFKKKNDDIHFKTVDDPVSPWEDEGQTVNILGKTGEAAHGIINFT